MGKSYKKHAIVKEKGIKTYNRTCRRVIKNSVKEIKNLRDIEDYDLPEPKELINDWDICDYTVRLEEDTLKHKEKLRSAPKEYRK